MVHCEPQVFAIVRIQHDLEVRWADVFPVRLELHVRSTGPDMKISILTLKFHRVTGRLAARQ